MPVEHDLSQDFPEFHSQAQERIKSDPAFDRLVTDYCQLDGRILELEALDSPTADDELSHLRRERVLLKDRIAQLLQGT
ncbi:YdcH family protein [Pseudomonas mangiferae]|uniref:DUF465 domain-containing protein n=1 Tax=Pseudomonas mangiferae TaxID=2593654 RepID=A0A553GWB5_9PSED|nr:DUF465 domain-containing protein [Pseudomonas mangiferae]TRX73776.1 DUF465 domain-containing protein [Pseudomonas mangiferae]